MMPRQYRDSAVREVQRDEALLTSGALQSAIINSADFSRIATDAMNRITPADISDPQEMIVRAKALRAEPLAKLANRYQPFDRLGQEGGIAEGIGIGQVVSDRRWRSPTMNPSRPPEARRSS